MPPDGRNDRPVPTNVTTLHSRKLSIRTWRLQQATYRSFTFPRTKSHTNDTISLISHVFVRAHVVGIWPKTKMANLAVMHSAFWLAYHELKPTMRANQISSSSLVQNSDQLRSSAPALARFRGDSWRFQHFFFFFPQDLIFANWFWFRWNLDFIFADFSVIAEVCEVWLFCGTRHLLPVPFQFHPETHTNWLCLKSLTPPPFFFVFVFVKVLKCSFSQTTCSTCSGRAEDALLVCYSADTSTKASFDI